MCDIHVIRKDGVTYFAKNSDREPGEAQLVVRIPPVTGDTARRLQTTYIEIDQVPDRHGVILSKPAWLWGAEMGANDQGVVIGNTAVFTKVHDETPGLIGMDLLRLGLERGGTAREALEVIAGLLERHGQGGACGYRDKSFHYDNSFVIADPDEAWILETARREWAAKRMSVGATSNCLVLGDDFDLHSDGLESLAREEGLLSGQGELDFARTFDTRFLPYFAAAHPRVSASQTLLQDAQANPGFGLQDAMNNLRFHHADPFHASLLGGPDICMHAAGYVRRSQTCGSMVSRLSAAGCDHFFTGTSAPCLSIFRPATFDYAQEFSVLNQDGRTVDGSLWRRHEEVHRRALFDAEGRRELMASRDRVEAAMLAIFQAPDDPPTPKQIQAADQLAAAWEDEWVERYRDQPCRYPRFSAYARFWKQLNREDSVC